MPLDINSLPGEQRPLQPPKREAVIEIARELLSLSEGTLEQLGGDIEGRVEAFFTQMDQAYYDGHIVFDDSEAVEIKKRDYESAQKLFLDDVKELSPAISNLRADLIEARDATKALLALPETLPDDVWAEKAENMLGKYNHYRATHLSPINDGNIDCYLSLKGHLMGGAVRGDRPAISFLTGMKPTTWNVFTHEFKDNVENRGAAATLAKELANIAQSLGYADVYYDEKESKLVSEGYWKGKSRYGINNAIAGKTEELSSELSHFKTNLEEFKGLGGRAAG